MKNLRLAILFFFAASAQLWAQESNLEKQDKVHKRDDQEKHEYDDQEKHGHHVKKGHGHHGKEGHGKEGHGHHGKEGHGHHGKEGHGHHGKAGHRHHGTMPHDFNHQKWIGILNHPQRDAWQKPQLVIDSLSLKDNHVIADLGAGAGYFIPYLAAKITTGKIYALDVAPQLLAHIQTEARQKNWTQVETRQITNQSLGLEAQSLDKLLIVNTWHHLPQTKAYAQMVGQLLKADGQLYLIEFTMDAEQGPPKEHRIDPKVLIQQWQEAGFKAKQVIIDLPQQYMVMVYR